MSGVKYAIRTGLLLAILLPAAGCKTVVRENIISTINTGIGVSLAENPKTELYEVKVGYIRSQFYSVPTGKVVENENKADKKETTAKDGTKVTEVNRRKDLRSNQANLTPQLVSGIRMESDIRHLLVGIDVSESFAVGETAVLSPAAVAMYISGARGTNQARAAADAAIAVAESQEFVEFRKVQKSQADVLREIRTKYLQADEDGKKAIRDKAVELKIFEADPGADKFRTELNKYANNTPEHLDSLKKLLEEISK